MHSEEEEEDFCRVCRCEGTTDNPLFFPCRCTGSIKYIHQDCLKRWLSMSKRKYCELCHYKFSFTPVYRDDTPQKLPLHELTFALLEQSKSKIKYILRCILVGIGWLIVMPAVTRRIWSFYFVDHPWLLTATTAQGVQDIHSLLTNQTVINDTVNAAIGNNTAGINIILHTCVLHMY